MTMYNNIYIRTYYYRLGCACKCVCVYSVHPSLKICVAQGTNTYNNNIIITVVIIRFINAHNVDGPVPPLRPPP